MEKIIIFGGTFNPIHNAHLAIAKAASIEFGGAKVLFMPNGIAPHKETDLELMEHRVNMVKLAISDYDNFEYLDIEIKSGKVCYALNSFKALNEIYKGYEIYSLTGEDFLYTVQGWENAEGLFDLATFIVFSRPLLSFSKSLIYTKNNPYEKIEELKATKNAKIIYLDNVNMGLSASYLRKSFKSKNDLCELKNLVPEKVYEYIIQNKLYEEDDYLSYLIESIKRDVSVQLSEKRAKHVISVATTARCLAKIHGENEEKVYIAALLHDIAKEIPDDNMIALLEEKHLPTDKYEIINLNHALASRIIAEEVYGIKDEEILNAIENHTFGRVGMTNFEMIISIADFIEPERNFKGVFKENADIIREKANVDLIDAYTYKIESIIKDFESLGKNLEPDTINIYNDLKRRTKNDK